MQTFITVPNGVFPLHEVLAAPTTKQVIASLRSDPRADLRRLRIFLSFYQTFDMVAQLQNAGEDITKIDVEEIATAASLIIEGAFDIIMSTFNEEEQAFLNSLFKEEEVSHV